MRIYLNHLVMLTEMRKIIPCIFFFLPIFFFGFVSKSLALIYVDQPCSLVDGAFNITNNEYNINIGRAHYQSTDELDIGGSYGDPYYGNQYQSCKDDIAKASISGTVVHTYDSWCGGHTYLKINGSDNISVAYFHVDINAPNTIPNNTYVSAGQTIGTISDKGCTGTPPFKHIHYVVYQNGVKQSYSTYKFKPSCLPPSNSNWDIYTDCTITSNLDFDFQNYHILINNGAKLVIQNGAKIY